MSSKLRASNINTYKDITEKRRRRHSLSLCDRSGHGCVQQVVTFGAPYAGTGGRGVNVWLLPLLLLLPVVLLCLAPGWRCAVATMMRPRWMATYMGGLWLWCVGVQRGH
jgi:hypothetical protein